MIIYVVVMTWWSIVGIYTICPMREGCKHVPVEPLRVGHSAWWLCRPAIRVHERVVRFFLVKSVVPYPTLPLPLPCPTLAYATLTLPYPTLQGRKDRWPVEPGLPNQLKIFPEHS